MAFSELAGGNNPVVGGHLSLIVDIDPTQTPFTETQCSKPPSGFGLLVDPVEGRTRRQTPQLVLSSSRSTCPPTPSEQRKPGGR